LFGSASPTHNRNNKLCRVALDDGPADGEAMSDTFMTYRCLDCGALVDDAKYREMYARS